MKRFELMALAAMLAMTPICGANAAEIITEYEFNALASGPIANHTGSFSLSFNSVTGIYTLSAINFAIGSTNFSLANAAAEGSGEDWVVFGVQNGTSIAANTDDFFLQRLGGNFFFNYTAVGLFDFGRASSIAGDQASLSVAEGAGAVPEPSTWAMLLLGFFGLGAALRSRRSKQRSAISFG